MTVDEVEQLRTVIAQLDGIHEEFSAAARKKPDAAVSGFQIRLINKVIGKANLILGTSKPFDDFEGFDEDDLPTVGDVSLVAGQYGECAEKIRCENIVRYGTNYWYWRIGNEVSNIATVPPRSRR